jgi:hypothetical protein
MISIPDVVGTGVEQQRTVTRNQFGARDDTDI